MLPWMGVAWFDTRKQPSGLVLHSFSDGGNARRVILTKALRWSLYFGLDLRFESRGKRGAQTYEQRPG